MIVLFLALSVLGCGGEGGGVPPTAPVIAPKPKPKKQRVTVKASEPVTLVGPFARGTSVTITAVSGTWSAGPGQPSVSAEGEDKALCLGEGDHHCVGGDGIAARMSLVALMTSCPIEKQGCVVFGRDPVGATFTFTVPRDGWLYLGPNDWIDALADNTGAIEVDVEQSALKP